MACLTILGGTRRTRSTSSRAAWYLSRTTSDCCSNAPRKSGSSIPDQSRRGRETLGPTRSTSSIASRSTSTLREVVAVSILVRSSTPHIESLLTMAPRVVCAVCGAGSLWFAGRHTHHLVMVCLVKRPANLLLATVVYRVLYSNSSTKYILCILFYFMTRGVYDVLPTSQRELRWCRRISVERRVDFFQFNTALVKAALI